MYDFKAIGQAIKQAREYRGWTREKLAEMLDLAPRYLMSIEHSGQHPSLQKLYEIVTLLDISVDQYFFPESSKSKTTLRRQLDSCLDSMDDKGLNILLATAKAVKQTDETGA